MGWTVEQLLEAREQWAEAEARATRAEAHAERLASSLKLASDWLERRTWGHPADCDALDGSDDIIADARQALSAYNQRTET